MRSISASGPATSPSSGMRARIGECRLPDRPGGQVVTYGIVVNLFLFVEKVRPLVFPTLKVLEPPHGVPFQ